MVRPPAVRGRALIRAFGWDIADPIASIFISTVVVWSAWALLRDSVGVLMEGTPRHVDAREVPEALRSVEGVVDVHDLHVWTITTAFESGDTSLWSGSAP